MSRLKPEVRQDQIITAALQLAQTQFYTDITREQIAAKAGCATGSINRHFGTMTQLRRAMVRRAIVDCNIRVLAQAISAGDKHVRKIPDELRKQAVTSLMEG